MLQEICNVFPHVEFPYFLESICGIIPLEVLALCVLPGWFKHFRDAGWISTHWEGVMLIRNRSAPSYRSGVTSGIRENPCVELLPPWVVLVTIPVLCWQCRLFPGWSGKTITNTTFVTREGSQSSCMGTWGCRTQECHVPNRWHVLGDRQIRAKGGFRVTLLLCHGSWIETLWY